MRRTAPRMFYSRTLAWRHERYAADGESTSYAETDRALTELKKDPGLAFLNEVSSVPLQQALRHQHQAFAAFFAGHARYPRFKSRNGRQSAHFTIDAQDPEPLPDTGRETGVDLGVKDFAVLSTGEKIANPRHVERKARSLARYQRRLARCQKGSGNRAKAKKKVARAHRKVRDARRDFLHKTSTAIVRGSDMIAVEDLNVSGMVRNHSLAHAISDCSWAEFRTMLEYKCERSGRRFVVIDRWFPSSRTCSACGHLLAQLSLSTRHWTCPSCGARHDRDVNAAKNVLAAGQAVARGDPGHACGADVRHSGTSRVQSAAKQEPRRATAGIPVLQDGE